MTQAKILELLRQAVQCLNDNQPEKAEPLLTQALAVSPDMPQALMLMGVARHLLKQYAQAESFLSQAQRLSPRQPAVLFHLGSALRAQGKYPAAINAYEAALRISPDHGDAGLALGASLREMGAFAAAEPVYRALLQRMPHFLPAIAGLAATLIAMERGADAETLLRTADTDGAEPAVKAELENAFGEAQMLQRRHAEALIHFERAATLSPTYLAAERNRATALEYLHEADGAAAAYRQVLAQDPLDLTTHLLLNELLHRNGDSKNFLRSYDEAARLAPNNPLLPAAKADQLLKLGRAAEAHDNFAAALDLSPENVVARIGHARALAALGESDRAIASFALGLRQHPENADLQTAYSYCLLSNSEPKKAQNLAERAVTTEPYNQAALSVLDLCYRVNDDARAAILNDFEKFVAVFDLDPPAGFSDMAQFLSALETHVDGMHAGSREFFSQTLRGGTRSHEDFFRYGDDLRAKLKQSIDQALARFIGAMADMPDHPFVGRRKRDFVFTGSWTSRMAEGGYHVNHIHSGWISSAFYVAVPDAAANPDAKQGWLKFGEPSGEVGLKEPIRRTVQPVPGRLAVFPSYMWHGTIPYRGSQPRTTVAFDVIPR